MALLGFSGLDGMGGLAGLALRVSLNLGLLPLKELESDPNYSPIIPTKMVKDTTFPVASSTPVRDGPATSTAINMAATKR